jgi:hypothetical protein
MIGFVLGFMELDSFKMKFEASHDIKLKTNLFLNEKTTSTSDFK